MHLGREHAQPHVWSSQDQQTQNPQELPVTTFIQPCKFSDIHSNGGLCLLATWGKWYSRVQWRTFFHCHQYQADSTFTKPYSIFMLASCGWTWCWPVTEETWQGEGDRVGGRREGGTLIANSSILDPIDALLCHVTRIEAWRWKPGVINCPSLSCFSLPPFSPSTSHPPQSKLLEQNLGE